MYRQILQTPVFFNKYILLLLTKKVMNDYKYNFYICTDNYFSSVFLRDSAFTPLGVSRHTAYQLLGINYSGSIRLKLVPKFIALLFLLFYIYLFL